MASRSALPDERTGSAAPDPEVVRRRIRERAEAIERRQLEEVFSRLEANGALTDARRETIERLATAIVDDLLAAPEDAIERASNEDERTLRTALDVFAPPDDEEVSP